MFRLYMANLSAMKDLGHIDELYILLNLII